MCSFWKIKKTRKEKAITENVIDKDDFYIEGTKNTPKIHFRKNGNCEIRGDSIPETLDELYKDAKLFLHDLISQNIVINFTFDFDYFNTCTQRYIFDILEELNKQPVKGNTVWICIEDDEDSNDMGDIYKTSFPELKIKLKTKK